MGQHIKGQKEYYCCKALWEKAGNDETDMVAIISSESVDRVNDRMILDGMKIMVDPMFLWAHDKNVLPPGRLLWTKRDMALIDGKLIPVIKSGIKFNGTFLGTSVHDLYKSGDLKYFSIGFNPIKWTQNGLGDWGTDWLEWELLEVSAVTVPANRDAKAESVKSIADDSYLAYKLDFVSRFEKGLIDKAVAPRILREFGIDPDIDICKKKNIGYYEVESPEKRTPVEIIRIPGMDIVLNSQPESEIPLNTIFRRSK